MASTIFTTIPDYLHFLRKINGYFGMILVIVGVLCSMDIIERKLLVWF